MGHDLTRMLRAGMPPEWTLGERAVALVLADICNDRTRQSPAGVNAGRCVCEELAITPGTLGNILAKLAGRGFELRVPIGNDRRGRPLFAVKGHAVDYMFPLLLPRGCDGPPVDGACAAGPVDNPPDGPPNGPLTDGALLPMVHSGVAYGPSTDGPLTPETQTVNTNPTNPVVSLSATSVEVADAREAETELDDPADFEAVRQRKLREFEAWMSEHPEAS
jgi:hypothetical protein